MQQRITNYQNKILSKSNSAILISNYTRIKEKVNAKCLKCGYEWTNRADHLLDRCYCSKCKNNDKNCFKLVDE